MIVTLKCGRMIFEFPIIVSANTLETDAVTQVLSLSSGTITQFSIEFPPGCAGLVHVIILERDQQLWPANPDGSFASDDFPLIYQPNYRLHKSPYELITKVWNNDVRYPHTPVIRFEVVPKGESLIEQLLRLFTFR